VTAVLFAAEHGPYWDVELLAGITYNWWMLRTHRLADCIAAHTATNAACGLRAIRPAIGNIGCERLLAIWSANIVRITLLTAIGTSVPAGSAAT
jgi:hypothetical protein